MKIYLACPFFNEYERETCTCIVQQLRKYNYEVYAPFEHEVPNAWAMENRMWGICVFEEDVKAINECDEVWVMNFGLYSDSGTAWECGYAYGIGKPVRQILDTTNEKKYSLMMINGSTSVMTLESFLFEEDLECDFEVK